MKKTVFYLMISMVIVLSSCRKDELAPEPSSPQEGILPERFMVEIPDALSGKMYKSTQVDTLQGDDIYAHMRNFIFIGGHAAMTVNEIIFAISFYQINHPMTFTFISQEDQRLKQVVVIENAFFEGLNWEFEMTVTDIDPDQEPEDGKALQIFWNRNPIKGIAIMNPYNINRIGFSGHPEIMYRIDYSEAQELGYERHMVVYMTNLPLEHPLTNPYSMKTMKMFAGKNGNMISLFGNSEHPNATFISGDVGFDWAFTAGGNITADIGVAEVGLPSHLLDASDRYTLLEENSIRNVFMNQIYEMWPGIDSTVVQAFLHHTDPPGYFASGGFVQGGNPPSPQYAPLETLIEGLTPYNPLFIHEMVIAFKEEDAGWASGQ
ncbi:MAG: hypothetical protein JW861_04245 [Bacteroidales bacterium]|nr:hypothetical protein [Bacteroidales bacterium]